MEHQIAILDQRISNLQSGIKKSEEYVAQVSRMLLDENPDIKEVRNNLGEIRDFLLWLSSQ